MNNLADYKIFLDDKRLPAYSLKDAVVVRNFWEFKETIKNFGIPSYVSFDHDLGDLHYTGKHCAEFLVMCLEDYPHLAKDFKYDVHSQNPVGAENIRKYLEWALKVLVEQDENE